MKSYILTVAATALLSIPTINFAEDKLAAGPVGDKPAGERPHRPGGPGGERPHRPGGPGGERHSGSPEERLKMMTERLGLTQDQQDKIKAIYAKNADTMKAFREKGRENLTEDDKAKIRELMKAQFEEVSNVLTPEQKEKMKKAREEHGGGRGGKPGEGAKPAEAK